VEDAYGEGWRSFKKDGMGKGDAHPKPAVAVDSEKLFSARVDGVPRKSVPLHTMRISGGLVASSTTRVRHKKAAGYPRLRWERGGERGK